MTLAELAASIYDIEEDIKPLYDLKHFMKLTPVQRDYILRRTRTLLNLITVQGQKFLRTDWYQRLFVEKYNQTVGQLARAGYQTERLQATAGPEVDRIKSALRQGLVGAKQNMMKTLAQKFEIFRSIDMAIEKQDTTAFKPRQTLLHLPRPRYTRDEKTGTRQVRDTFNEVRSQVTKILDDHISEGASLRATQARLHKVLEEKYPSGYVYFPVYPKDKKPYIRRESLGTYAERWVRDAEQMSEYAAFLSAAKGAGADLVVRKNRTPGNVCPICSPHVGKVHSLSGDDKRFPKALPLPAHPGCDCYYKIASQSRVNRAIEEAKPENTIDTSFDAATTLTIQQQHELKSTINSRIQRFNQDRTNNTATKIQVKNMNVDVRFSKNLVKKPTLQRYIQTVASQVGENVLQKTGTVYFMDDKPIKLSSGEHVLGVCTKNERGAYDVCVFNNKSEKKMEDVFYHEMGHVFHYAHLGEFIQKAQDNGEKSGMKTELWVNCLGQVKESTANLVRDKILGERKNHKALMPNIAQNLKKLAFLDSEIEDYLQVLIRRKVL